MARRALSPTRLQLVHLLEQAIPEAQAATGVDACRIGLSGGADSLALTAAMAWARDHRNGPLASIEVTARIVDHNLQPDSAAVAAAAAGQAESLGIAAEVVRVHIDSSKMGIEAAAREARYAALHQGPPALILLAHTLDDQAETVLLGLARGSGVRSLAGMASLRDFMVRPFLSIRRSDTEKACDEWGLTWWNDPTNHDPAYSRSRLRAALPQLEETLGPKLVLNLARTAQLCRIDADYLDQLARNCGVDVNQTTIPVCDLLRLDPALRHRLLLHWLRPIGRDAITREHVLAVDALLTDWHGQKSVLVPGGQVSRSNQNLNLLLSF